MVNLSEIRRRNKLKRTWNALNNLNANLHGNKEKAKSLRKMFYDRTGNKKFKETVYQDSLKKGKTFTVKDVREAHKLIKEQVNTGILKAYNAEIKDRVILELSKAYRNNVTEKNRRTLTFQNWLRLKSTKDLAKTIKRLEKRNLSVYDYKKANKPVIDKLENWSTVEEMYNSPD